MAITIAAGIVLTGQMAITLASIAYQISQARKMKKAAQAAADARKGYELVIEGEGVTLPIVYGRAKVGGVRSYHNTSNNFVMTTPNSDKVFASDSFNTNVSGRANEFLFFQQAICQGPINKVYDVVLEESRYLDDPDLSTTQTITTSQGDGEIVPYSYSTSTSIKSGLRIDLHYGDTPVADAIMSANNPERVNSVFTQIKDSVGLAYASVCIKLDRDDPALSGVPTVQFFIEGKKVKSITRSGTVGSYSYALSSARTYSNNPALCLLDYLTDTTSGKSLDISLIDLESFYNATILCDTVVMPSAPVGGKIYKPTVGNEGAENVTTGNTRSIRLYECNAIIDTQKPVRENVEAILATMGDARLVWSGGRYKLNTQYPASNSAINIATTLTDDDLAIDDSVAISWPTSSERLNHCTVRFHNESENFKEDTVSWPPKVSGISLRGVGGFKYPQSVDEEWNDTPGGTLLKKYSVWSGSGSSFDQTWKFFVKETGTFDFEFTGDNAAEVFITTVDGTSLYTGVSTNWQNTTIGTVNLVKDTEYRIRLTAQDSGGSGKGVAGKLSKGSFVYWTTRSDNYTSLLSVTNSNVAYLEMKAEDNNLELETDIFADGITDYYHALAKAEELVRTSRSAFGLKFKYIVKDKFLEPGDFIKLSSHTLSLGIETDLYLRVSEVRITDEAICEVTATRFDYTQLAWNVSDTEYVKALNVYSFAFGTPSNLQYIAETAQILNSSGRLSWTGVDKSQLDCYITYYHFPGNVTPSGEVIWTELGRTTDTQYILPPLTLDQTIFGVRALSKGGKLSDIARTDIVAPIFATAFSGKSVKLKASGRAFVKEANTSVVSPTAIVFSVNITGFDAPNYKWYVDEVLQPGQTSGSFTISSFDNIPTKDIKVRVTEGTSSTFLEDFETIYFINAGSDSYAIGLSESSISLTCDSEGVPAQGQLPQSIDIYVYRGANPLSSGVTYILNPVGCTLQSNTTTNGSFIITAVNDPYARVDIDATITAASLTLSTTLRIAKSTAAATRLVTLDPDRLAFVYPSNSNTQDYASINIYAREEAFDNPRYVWDIDGVNPGVSDTTSMITLNAFPSGQTKNINVEVYEFTDPTIRRVDSITLYSVKDGSSAYNFDYIDANRTVGCDAEGNILPDFFPLTMTPLLFRGITNIANAVTIPANTSTVLFSVVSGSTANLDVVVNPSTGVVTINNFTGALTDRIGTALIRAVVASDGSIHEKKIVINKAADGTNGLDAPVVNLTSSGIAFIQPKNTTTLTDVFPASITFTASVEGVENARYTWFVDNTEVVPQGITSTYSINKYIGQPKLVKVIVTSSTDNTVNVYDQMTIFSVKDGDDSYNATLTNENKTLRYTAAGVLSPSNQLPFSVTMQVARGAAYLTSGLTYYPDPEITPTNLTATIAESTGVITVTGISADVGKATFIAKLGTVIVGRKELIVNKSVDGKDGVTPYNGWITNDNQGVPSNETGAVTGYDGATGQFLVYKGTEIAAGVTYEYETSTGFSTPPTGTINSLGVYQITTGINPSPSVNTATVTYIAKVGTEIVSRKVFTLTKMKSTSVYSILPSFNSITYDEFNLAYSPTTLVFNSQVKSGNTVAVAYAGKIEIQGSSDGSSWSTIGSITDNTTSKSIAINSSTVPLTTKFLRGVLYLAGTTTVVDTQTVPLLIATKGIKGDKGDVGITGSRGGSVLTRATSTLLSNLDVAYECELALNNAYIGDEAAPRSGDRVTLFNSSEKWSRTYLYNGSTWGYVTLYVDGSAVITGSLSTSALAIGNTTGANRILLTDSQLIVYGSDNQKRVVIGNLAI